MPPTSQKRYQIKPGLRLWIIFFGLARRIFTEVINGEMIAEQVRQSCIASTGRGAKTEGVGAKLEVPLIFTKLNYLV